MADLPIPVLAKLHGPIAGAGVGLALGCDLAIAADDVRFNLAYSRIGASPDGSATWLLPRLVGLRRAMEIVLLSDNVPAAEALRLGLVNWVVPAYELDTETDKLVHQLYK
jgi:2-(1,2-epoxy-1,2-dihydrophenyl)acetyl-CoA isomerase